MRWYYGWTIVAVALVFEGVAYGIGFFSFTFFVDSWMTEFDTGRGEILTAITAATLVLGGLGPFAGKMLDRMSIRALVCMGGAVFSLGLVLLSQATAVWQIIAIYAGVISIGLAFAGNLPGQTLAAKWFRGRRGLAIGLVATGTSIGGFLLPPLVTFLIETFDWRAACLILAGLSALAILPMTWLLVRNSPEDMGIEPEAENERSLALSAGFAGKVWTTTLVLRERAFWITILAFLPAACAFSSIQHNLGPYAGDLGINAQRASFLMSVIAGTMIGGKMAFGMLADRYDNRYLYWVAAGFMLAALAILLGQPDYTLLLLVCAFLGISAGGTLPLLGSIVSHRFGPKAFGQVMGLLMPFLTLSSLAPMASGWVRDTAGSYDAAFLTFGILMVPAVVGMAFLPKLADHAPATPQPAKEAV